MFARPNGKWRFSTVEQELDALVRYAPTYRSLEGSGADPDIAWIGSKLGLWEVTTAYPLIFVVAVSALDGADKRKIYQLLYSYLVRRGICGLTAKNLNKNFQRIVSALLRDGVSVQCFENTFRDQKGDSVRFPSDEEVRLAVERQPVYERFYRKERLQEILWELECAARGNFAVNTPKPALVSIEHIMPKQWKEHWPLPNGKRANESDILLDPHAFDEETREAVQNRSHLIHTLGNLTLVTSPANTVASNGPFDEKKTLLQQSLLEINRRLIAMPSWSEETIRQRSSLLTEDVLKIWPDPKIA